MIAERVINRLTRVKQTAKDRWVASCPTAVHRHGDRSRGLSIREVQDRVLIFCHAGCGAAEVLDAIGLSLGDLYDRRPDAHREAPNTLRLPATDLLVILDHEISVAVLILGDIVRTRAANESQVGRLCLAAARIGKARDIACPDKVASHGA